MPSSPPGASGSRPALPRLLEATFRARATDETVLFACVEGAPPEACHTENEPGGALTFDTRLHGRVLATHPDQTELEVEGKTVVVRHLLPTALDLGPLVGHIVHVHVRQRYGGPGRATIDARVRDGGGRLLLWAHDGRFPTDREGLGLALRARVDPDGHRLALVHGGGVQALRAPDVARVWIAGDAFELGLLRAGADDVAFVLVRG